MEDVLVSTVDGCQGHEADLVFVVTTKMGLLSMDASGAFWNDERRVNVALSRGKFGMVIVGDLKMLWSAGGIWRRFLRKALESTIAVAPEYSVAMAHHSSEYIDGMLYGPNGPVKADNFYDEWGYSGFDPIPGQASLRNHSPADGRPLKVDAKRKPSPGGAVPSLQTPGPLYQRVPGEESARGQSGPQPQGQMKRRTERVIKPPAGGIWRRFLRKALESTIAVAPEYSVAMAHPSSEYIDGMLYGPNGPVKADNFYDEWGYSGFDPIPGQASTSQRSETTPPPMGGRRKWTPSANRRPVGLCHLCKRRTERDRAEETVQYPKLAETTKTGHQRRPGRRSTSSRKKLSWLDDGILKTGETTITRAHHDGHVLLNVQEGKSPRQAHLLQWRSPATIGQPTTSSSSASNERPGREQQTREKGREGVVDLSERRDGRATEATVEESRTTESQAEELTKAKWEGWRPTKRVIKKSHSAKKKRKKKSKRWDEKSQIGQPLLRCAHINDGRTTEGTEEEDETTGESTDSDRYCQSFLSYGCTGLSNKAVSGLIGVGESRGTPGPGSLDQLHHLSTPISSSQALSLGWTPTALLHVRFPVCSPPFFSALHWKKKFKNVFRFL
uniref:DNA2/NAM7 helicase-like C-terminal domain-containing protein n=1 Tax=Globodera rostochiensis TaxID=31243 RepID=A0A914H664_GLORO